MSARADFICLVHRSPVDCAVLHVTPTVPIRIRLLHAHADCVQPL
jgi:hypothetical protein